MNINYARFEGLDPLRDSDLQMHGDGLGALRINGNELMKLLDGPPSGSVGRDAVLLLSHTRLLAGRRLSLLTRIEDNKTRMLSIAAASAVSSRALIESQKAQFQGVVLAKYRESDTSKPALDNEPSPFRENSARPSSVLRHRSKSSMTKANTAAQKPSSAIVGPRGLSEELAATAAATAKSFQSQHQRLTEVLRRDMREAVLECQSLFDQFTAADAELAETRARLMVLYDRLHIETAARIESEEQAREEAEVAMLAAHVTSGAVIGAAGHSSPPSSPRLRNSDVNTDASVAVSAIENNNNSTNTDVTKQAASKGTNNKNRQIRNFCRSTRFLHWGPEEQRAGVSASDDIAFLGDPEGEGGRGKKTKKDEASAPRAFPANMSSYHIAQLLIRGVVLSKRTSNEIERLTKLLAQPQQQQHEQLSPNSSSSAPASNRNEEVLGAQLRGLQLEFHNQTLKLTQQFSAPEAQRIVFLAIIIQKNMRRRNAMRQFGALSSWRAHVDEHRRVEAFKAWRRRLAAEILARHQKLRLVWRVLQKNAGDAILRRTRFLTLLHSARGRATMRRSFLMWHRFSVYVNSPVDEYTHLRLVRKFEGDEPGDNNEQQPTTDSVPEGMLQQSAMGSSAQQVPRSPAELKHSQRTGSVFGGAPVSPSLARRMSRNETLRVQFGVRPKRSSASGSGDSTPITLPVLSAGNSPSSLPRVTLLLGDSAKATSSSAAVRAIDFGGSNHLSGGGSIMSKSSFQIAQKIDSLELSIEGDEDEVIPKSKAPISPQQLHTSVLLGTSTGSSMPFGSAPPPPPPRNIASIEEIYARRFRLHAWDKFLAEDVRRVKLMRSGVLCGTDPLLNQAYYLNRWRKYVDSCRQKRRKVAMAQRHYELTVVGKHFFGWLNLRCFGAQQKAKNKAVKCLAFTVWKRYVYREKRDHERCQALKGMRALKLLQLWRYRTIHYRRHLAAANLALTLNRARLLFPMLCMLSAGDPVYELQGLRGPSAHSLTVAREHDVSATSTSLGPLIVTDGSSSKAQRKIALQNILGQPSVGEAPSAGEEPSNFDISLVQSALESRRKGNDGIKRQTDALTAEEIGDYQRLQQREPRPIPTAEESQRYQSYVTERVFIGCWHQWKDYTNRRVNYKMFVASRWSRRMRRLKAGSLAAWRYFMTLCKLERKGRNTSDTIPPTADSKKMLAMFSPEAPGPLLQELSVLRSKRKRSQLVLRFAMLQKREDAVGGFVMSEEEMILATGGPSAFENATAPASRTGGRNNIGAMAGSNVRGNAGPTPAKLLAFNPIQLFSEIVGPVGNTTDLIHDVADAKATFNNWMRVIAGTREGNDLIKAKANGHHMYELLQSASNTNDHLMMRGFLQMLVLNLRRENHRRKDADAHWAHQNGLTSLSSQPQAQVSPQLGPQQSQLNQRGLSTSGGADSGDSRRVSGQTTSKTLTSLNLCAQSAEHKRRLSGLSGGVGTNNGEGALSAQGRSNYAATATVVSGQQGHRSPTNGGTEINEANSREEALDQKIRQNMLLVMCVGYPLYRSLSNEVTIGKIEQFGSEESKTYVVRDVRRHRRDNKILRKFLTRLHAHKFANASAFFAAIPLTHSIDMSPYSMLIDRYNGIVAAAAEAAAKAAKKGSKRIAASPNTSSGKKAAFVKPSKYKIPLPQVQRKRQLPYLLRLHLEGIVSSHRSQASIQNRKCLHIKGQLGITWLRLVEATLHQAAARNMPMAGVDGGWLFHYTTTTTATGVGRAIGADNGSMPLGITGRGASMTPGMSFDAAAGSYNGSPSISGALYADARSRLGTGIGGSISPASGSIFGGVAIPTPMSAVMGGGVGLSAVAGVGMLTAQQRELMDSADAHRNKLLTLLRATEDLSANDAALRKKVRTVGMAIIQRIWDLHGGIGRAPATYSYSATAAPAKVAIDASRRGSEVSVISGGRRASYVIGGAMENYGRQGILSSKQPATPAEPTAIAIDHRSNVAGAPLPFALGGTALPPSPAASALAAPERRLSLLGAATAPTQSATAANSSLKKGTMGQLVTHGNAFYGPYPADFFDVLDLVGFNPYYLRRGAATSKTNQLNQSRKTYKLQRMLALVLQLEKIRESEPFVVVVEHPVERSSTSNLVKAAAAAELGIDEIKEYEVQMPWGGIVRGAYGGQTTGAALKRTRSGFANSSFSFLADMDEHEESVASSSVTSSFRVSRTTSSSKKHKDGRLSRSASNVASANDIRKAKISPSMPYQLATLIAANPKKFDVEVRSRRRRWSAHSLPEMLARHERIARRHGGVSQDGGSAFQSGSMAELFSLGDNDSSCLWQTVYDRPLRKIVATEIVSKVSQSSTGGPLTSPLTTPPTSPQADKAISTASSTPLRSTGLLSPDQAELYSLMDADTDPFAPLEARVAHRLRRIAIGAGITNAMSEMVQSLTKEAEERLHDKATEMASRTNGASAAPPFGSSASTQKGGALFSTSESKADSDDERRLDDMDPVEKRRLQAELMFELQSQSRAGARGTGGFVGKQKPTTISQALKATAAIAHKHNQSGGNTTSAISAARKANAGQSAGKPLYGAQRGGAREGNLGAQSMARALSQRPYSNRLKGDEKVSYDIITGAISGSREALIGILKHRVETYRAFFSRSGRARSCPAHIAVPVPDPAEDMYDTDYLSSRMGALRRGGGAKKPYVDAVDSAEANRQKILNEMMATQKNLLADKGGNGNTKHFLLDADDDEEAKRKRRNPLRLDDAAKTLLMSDFSFGDQYVETPRSDFEGSGRKRGTGEPKTVGTTLTTNADKLRMMMGSTSEANKDADKSASVSTDDIDQAKRKGREESIEATRLRELKELAERMLKESGNVVQMQIDMEKVFEEQRLAAEAEDRQRLRKEEEGKMLLLSPHLGSASSTTRPPTADISGGGMTKRGSFSNQQQPLTHTADNSNNSSMNRKPSVKELRDVMLASALETSRRTSSMRDLANSPLSPKTTLRGAADSNNAPSSTAQIRNTSFSGFGNFVDNNSIAIEKEFGGATQPDGSIVPVVAKGLRRQSSASPTKGSGSDDDYEEGDEDEDEDMGGELTVSNTLLEAELAKMVVREESKRNLADDAEDDEEIDDTATTAGSSEGSQARKGRGGSLASRSSAVKPTNSMGKSGRVSRVASTTGKISRTSSTSSRAVVTTRSTIGKGFNKSTRTDAKVVVYPTGLAGRIPSTSAMPNQSDLITGSLYRSSKTNIGGARTMQQPLFSGEVPTDQPTPTTTISLNEQTGSLTLVGPINSSADAILLPSLQRVSAVGTPARIWADLDEGKVTAKATERLLEITTRRGTALDAANKIEMMLLKSQLEELLGQMRDIEASEEAMAARATNLEESVERNPFQEDPNSELEPRPLSHSEGAQHIETGLKLPEMAGNQSGGLADTSATSPLSASLSLPQLRSREDVLLQQRHPQRTLKAGSPVRIAGQNAHHHPKTTSVEGLAQPVFFSANQLIIDRQAEEDADRRRREAESAMGIRSATPHTLTTRSHLKPNSAPGTPFQVSTNPKVAAQVADRRKKWAKAMENMTSGLTTSAQPPCTTSEEVGYNYHRRASRYPDQEISGARCATPPKAKQLPRSLDAAKHGTGSVGDPTAALLTDDELQQRVAKAASILALLPDYLRSELEEMAAEEQEQKRLRKLISSGGSATPTSHKKKSSKKGPRHAEQLFPHIPTSEISVVNSDRPHSRAATTPVKPQSPKSKASHSYSLKVATPQPALETTPLGEGRCEPLSTGFEPHVSYDTDIDPNAGRLLESVAMHKQALKEQLGYVDDDEEDEDIAAATSSVIGKSASKKATARKELSITDFRSASDLSKAASIAELMQHTADMFASSQGHQPLGGRVAMSAPPKVHRQKGSSMIVLPSTATSRTPEPQGLRPPTQSATESTKSEMHANELNIEDYRTQDELPSDSVFPQLVGLGTEEGIGRQSEKGGRLLLFQPPTSTMPRPQSQQQRGTQRRPATDTPEAFFAPSSQKGRAASSAAKERPPLWQHRGSDAPPYGTVSVSSTSVTLGMPSLGTSQFLHQPKDATTQLPPRASSAFSGTRQVALNAGGGRLGSKLRQHQQNATAASLVSASFKNNMSYLDELTDSEMATLVDAETDFQHWRVAAERKIHLKATHADGIEEAQMQLESLRRKRQQLNQHRDNKMACRMSTVVGRQQDDVVALLNIPCPLADDLFTIHQQSIQPAAVLVQRLPQAASRAPHSPQPANLSLSRPSTPQAGSSSPPRYTSDGLLLAPQSPIFAQGTDRSKVQ